MSPHLSDQTARAVLLLVTGEHLIVAATALLSHRADQSTGVATMLLLIPDRMILVALLVVASVMAWHAVGAIAAPLWRGAALALQQFLVVIPAFGAVVEAINGHYADGYVPGGGGVFILVDQLPRIFFAVAHTYAICRHSWPRRRRDVRPQ